MKYSYDYPRPSVTTDIVIFGFDGNQLKVLLIQRDVEPFKSSWALPGGFLREDETLEECAMRELKEETAFVPDRLEQFHVYSAIDRDPRTRVVTVAFFGLMPIAEVKGDTDAAKAEWFAMNELPPLAFDHKQILDDAIACMRERIYFEPIAFRLLDAKFTMTELQRVYEIVLDTQFDRRNFQKKMLTNKIVKSVNERRFTNTPRRPATLYTFDNDVYVKYKEDDSAHAEF